MNIAVILSGGTGSRAGLAAPKQYVEGNGKPMICYCLETFFAHDRVDAVQIVADPAWREAIRRHVMRIEKEREAPGKFRGFSKPGKNRQMSIYNALTDVRGYAGEEDTVIIHDAARPFVKAAQISRCLADMEGHDGVIPVLPMKDTVYLSDGKGICALLDRQRVCAGQAPEFFRLGKYYKANEALLPGRILSVNGSTEPAVMAGMDVGLSQGDEGNFKVTTKQDMEAFWRIVRSR